MEKRIKINHMVYSLTLDIVARLLPEAVIAPTVTRVLNYVPSIIAHLIYKVKYKINKVLAWFLQ